MVKSTEPIPSTYDLASSATSVLLLNLVEEVASGFPLADTTSTSVIGDDVPLGVDAGHPPRLSGPPDLSQSSQAATMNDSRTWMQDLPLGSAIHGLSTFNSAASLSRQNTILAAGSSPHRNARELKTILGSANAKLKRDSSLPLNSNKSTDSSVDGSVLHLEGGNARARVQLDLILENDTCIQGGYLNGLILLTVRKKGNGIVMLSEGKMRIIGFESIMHEKERAAFYELSVPLSTICLSDLDDLYLAGPNDDGFMLANEGQFTIPFALYLDPKATSLPPKGSFPPHSGVALRYILMASIRIKDPISDDKSLAHFYRDVHIWPRWDLAFCLTPLPRPIQVTMSGFEGSLKFSIILQRLQWFAGQHCHLKFYVVNNTSKPIKNLTVELHRDTITWRPRGDPAVTDDFGEPETSTVSKLIMVSSLPAGDRAEKGYASARGWWAGVHSGESLHFYHSLLLPPDALSVTKGRLLEIEYRIKATISSGNLLPTELSAEVPIRIINFISVDPPPSQANTTPALMTRSSVASNATLPGPPYSAILAATLDPGSGDMQRGEGALNIEELVLPPMMALDSERSRSYACRFADLYYQGQQEGPMHQEPKESRSAKGRDDLTTENRTVPSSPPEMNVLRTQTSVYSQATFHTRNVETGHMMKSSIPVGGVLPPSVPSTHISPSDRTRNESSKGWTVDAPKNPMPDISPSPKKLPSRELPEPPSVVASKTLLEERVSNDSRPLPITPSRSASPLPPRVTPSVTLSGSRSACSTTSFPLSPGAVSVKDKIRELEERVKAIESSATTPM